MLYLSVDPYILTIYLSVHLISYIILAIVCPVPCKNWK